MSALVQTLRDGLEYSYCYQDDYDIIWWMRSELPSTLLDDYALWAAKLKLPGWDSGDPNLIMAKTARSFLETQSRWLLVFKHAIATIEAVDEPKGYKL